MSSSLNVSGVHTEQLKLLQKQILQWLAGWATTGQSNCKPCTPDMSDIVTVLQSVGFRLRRLDAVNAEDITPLEGAEKGVRVVITCGHSGQTGILEFPTSDDNCKCVKIPDNNTSGDCFWEVTALSSSKDTCFIETGCDLLPAVSKDVSILTSNVLNYLCQLINGNKELSQIEIPLQDTPVTSKVGRYSDSFVATAASANYSSPYGPSNFAVPKPIGAQKSSEKKIGIDSPARYRSLDTLTSSTSDKILPEPGTLIPKIDVRHIQNSTEMLTLQDQEELTSSTIEDNSFNMNSKTISHLRKAYESMKVFFDNIDSVNRSVRTPVTTKSSSTSNLNMRKPLLVNKVNVASTGNIPKATHNSIPNLTKPVAVVASKLAPLKKYGIKSALAVNGKHEVRDKKLESDKVEPRKSTLKKYANIKSTIPKPDAAKKKETIVKKV